MRPEGPAKNRPGRKAGIRLFKQRAPKVRHSQGNANTRVCNKPHYGLCRAFSAHRFSLTHPGLTAGPIHLRPFGPDELKCISFETASPDPSDRKVNQIEEGRRFIMRCGPVQAGLNEYLAADLSALRKAHMEAGSLN